jgi:hypothetical protein
MPKEYVGDSTVAGWCGVSPAAVSNWRTRQPEGCPEADVVVRTGRRVTYGWDPVRKHELISWAQRISGNATSTDATITLDQLAWKLNLDGASQELLNKIAELGKDIRSEFS